jgi:transcriptional regulator with XRE-family HTH domain
MGTSIHSRRHQLFREMLVEERKRKSLTQTEVADRLQRPQSFVSKYEIGERELSVLDYLDIAGAIGFDPAAFVRQFQKRAESV